MGQTLKRGQDTRNYACDRFSPSQSTLPATRNMRPGYTESWAITQADGSVSIGDSGLAFTAQSSPAWGDLGLASSSTYARALNTGAFFDIASQTTGESIVGLFSSQTVSAANCRHGFYIRPGTISRAQDYTDTGSTLITAITDRTCLGVLPRSGGGAYYVIKYFADVWGLYCVDYAGTGDNSYIGISSYDSDLVVRTAFAPDFQHAIAEAVDEASPSFGVSYGEFICALMDVGVTLPGSFVDGEYCHMIVGYVDADNWVSASLYITGGGLTFAFYENIGGSIDLAPGSSPSVLSYTAGQTLYAQVWSNGTGVGVSFRATQTASAWDSSGVNGLAGVYFGTAVRLLKSGGFSAANLKAYEVARLEISDRLDSR